MSERPVSKRSETEIKTKHVAVIGGGPAGALTAYLLAGKGVWVDIFEPRSTKKPDRSLGEKIPPCTGCAGLIQENTIDLLESIGLTISENIIQSRLENNVVHFPHTDQTVTIPSKAVTVYRGFSPVKPVEEADIESFDAWLLNKAIKAGAHHHQTKVKEVNRESDKITLVTDEKNFSADLIVGAYGNTESIELTGTLATAGLDQPVTNKAIVREYAVGKEVLAKFNKSTHLFGNPTKNIWFALILPKANYVTVALMGRQNIQQTDYGEFLNLDEVKKLLGKDIVQTKAHCGCTNPITIESPKHFIATNERGELILVNIGDAGPTRPRKNGIFAALDGARKLVETLFQYGIDKKAIKKYQSYMEHQYIWDNYFTEKVLNTFDWVLNNSLPRDVVISLAHSQIGLIRALATNTMDYVISGKGPYWQLLIQVLEESLFN